VSASDSNTTILIVDDELDMRTLVRIVIQMANDGLSVVGEASNGVEALDIWRSLNGPPTPDVVVLDNHMPIQSGLDTAREILAERPDQKILLYTAFLDDDIRSQAAAIGITTCLSKGDLEALPDILRHM